MSVRAANDYKEKWGFDPDNKRGISSREGIEALMRILGSEHGRVVLSHQELKVAIEQQRSFVEIAERRKSTMETHARPEVSTPYQAVRNDTEKAVAEIWEELLGFEQIGINDNYFDLGGDSLIATQVISRIHAVFGVKVPLQSLFESPTIAETAEIIEDKIAEEIEIMSDEEVKDLLRGEDCSHA